MNSRNLVAGEMKLGYSRPHLTVYGSVRNLTGGSAGNCMDGGTTMMLIMMNGAGPCAPA